MAEVCLIRNTYGGYRYLQNAINYISDDRAINLSGYGVNPYDSNIAYNQMVAIKNHYDKQNYNPLIHIVVAYNRDKGMNEAKATEYSDKCAQYYSNDYQVLYCTHEKDAEYPYYHTHMIINPVNYHDGSMFQSGNAEMQNFTKYVRDITNQNFRYHFKNKAEY